MVTSRQPTPPGKGVVTVAEAAELLHVSPVWLRRQLARHNGRLPMTVGGKRFDLVGVRMPGNKAPWHVSRASLNRILEAT